MSATKINVVLDRTDSGTPWGFRMTGGKDFGSPLTVQRVTPGSLAAKGGVQEGFAIIEIGSTCAEPLRHKEAQDLILAAGNSLELVLEKSSPQGMKTDTDSCDVGMQHEDSSMDIVHVSDSVSVGASVASVTITNNNSILKGPEVPKKPVHSAVLDDVPEGDHPRYRGFQDPSLQSKTFKQLQSRLAAGEDKSSSVKAAVPSPAVPSTKPAVSLKPVIAAKPSEVSTEANLNKESLVVKIDTQLAVTSITRDDDEAIDVKTERKTIVIPSASSRSKQGPPVAAPPAGDRDDIVSEPVERKTIVVPSARRQQQQLAADDSNRLGDGQTKTYQPSETYRMVHEMDAGVSHSNINPLTGAEMKPTQSRTLMMLDRALDNNETLEAPLERKTVVIPSSKLKSSPRVPAATSQPTPQRRTTQWPPPVPSGPRKMKVAKAGEAQNLPASDGGVKIPVCCDCGVSIRGPYVSAVGKTWCPDHFVCANPQCSQPLANIGFIEEDGQLFCEKDYAEHYAPRCGKCNEPIIGTVVSAMEQKYHLECFTCFHCHRPIANGLFRLEQGHPYCDNDWSTMFQTKCRGCQFPVEPGDRWVEALNQNWHAECFNCSTCQANLEGQSFVAKNGKPYCKKHSTIGRP